MIERRRKVKGIDENNYYKKMRSIENARKLTLANLSEAGIWAEVEIDALKSKLARHQDPESMTQLVKLMKKQRFIAREITRMLGIRGKAGRLPIQD